MRDHNTIIYFCRLYATSCDVSVLLSCFMYLILAGESEDEDDKATDNANGGYSLSKAYFSAENI